MQKIVLGVVIALVIGVGGYEILSTKKGVETEGVRTGESDVMVKEDVDQNSVLVEEESVVMDDVKDSVEMESALMMDAEKDAVPAVVTPSPSTPGTYEAYAPEKLARATTGDVVLFFKASWCPGCRALDSNISKRVSEIPSGVSILTLDYDTETALKKKYGITYQHTLVQVDAAGNQIAKWSGGTTLETVLEELN